MKWEDATYLIGEVNNVKKIGYVYKLYDESDTLIYIGKTICLLERMKNHRSEGRLWPLVSRIEYIEVPLADLDQEEIKLIHELHPKMNRQCRTPMCYAVTRERYGW